MHLDNIIDREQAGSHSGVSALTILRPNESFELVLQLLFINYEKAFDSLNSGYIWKTLHRRHTPKKLVAIFRETKCYRGKISKKSKV